MHRIYFYFYFIFLKGELCLPPSPLLLPQQPPLPTRSVHLGTSESGPAGLVFCEQDSELLCDILCFSPSSSFPVSK